MRLSELKINQPYRIYMAENIEPFEAIYVGFSNEGQDSIKGQAYFRSGDPYNPTVIQIPLEDIEDQVKELTDYPNERLRKTY